MTKPDQLVNRYNVRHFQNNERWQIYSQIKRDRERLERQGICMYEPYDAFISRITTDQEVIGHG